MTGTTILVAAALLTLAAIQPAPECGAANNLAGANPAAPTSPLHRTVFREKKRGRYEISIAYPQFEPPVDAAQRAFNRDAHDVAFGTEAGKKQAGKDMVAIYRGLDPPMAKGAENFYEVDYQAPYLDRRLASVLFQIGEYSGGAHPNGARTALLFDLEHGRALTLDDILAEPKAAIPAIAAECKARLGAEAEKEGWDFFDDADRNFAAVVGEVKSWSADKDGVDIAFDPYSVAAYVVGPRECRLSYAELAQWLKPGGPLPPHQEGKQ